MKSLDGSQTDGRTHIFMRILKKHNTEDEHSRTQKNRTTTQQIICCAIGSAQICSVLASFSVRGTIKEKQRYAEKMNASHGHTSRT